MRTRVFLSLLGLVSATAIAQPSDVPLANWTVPPYRISEAGGGMTTMVDLSPGIGFVAVTPCRIVDTRGGGVFTRGLWTSGPGGQCRRAAVRHQLRAALHGHPGRRGGLLSELHGDRGRWVFQNAFLTAWPTGGAQPVVSTLNFNAGQLVANAAIVPAGTNGSISVFVERAGASADRHQRVLHRRVQPGSVVRGAVSASAAPAIWDANTSTVANAVAIQGVITSTTPGDFATAVRAIDNGDGYGVGERAQADTGRCGGRGGRCLGEHGRRSAYGIW